jgi:hypothetical protein
MKDQFGPDRFQGDGRQEEFSALAVTDCGDEMVTRQEDFADTQIVNILGKYGINTPLRQMVYGKEIDESIDLQTALFAIGQARNIRPPEELEKKYFNWQTILNAVETGEYQYDLDQLAKSKADAEERKKNAVTQAPSPGVTAHT